MTRPLLPCRTPLTPGRRPHHVNPLPMGRRNRTETRQGRLAVRFADIQEIYEWHSPAGGCGIGIAWRCQKPDDSELSDRVLL